jgi:PKD repeat protein
MKVRVGLVIVIGFAVLLGAFGCALFSNRPPLARFSADPLSGPSPLVVHFDAGASSDPDGTIVSYQWTFGDGATATGKTPSHLFTTATTTTFSVRLTVTDERGATGTWSQSIDVHGAQSSANAPTARISADYTYGYTPLEVSFDASASSDPNGTIILYGWDFGDGSTGAGKTISHTFTAAVTRNYTVTLTVTDDQGETGTASLEVTVMVAETLPGDPPVARFTVSAPVKVYESPGLPGVPSIFEVAFDPVESAAAPGYEIVIYQWDFGDGDVETRSTNAAFTHLYSCAGQSCTFRAALIVVDNQGLQATFFRNVTVVNE